MEPLILPDGPTSRPKQFLEFPAEIRQQIYRYLFRDSIIRVHNPTTNSKSKSDLEKSSLAMLLTNKSIYNEARPAFLHNAVFVVDTKCDRHKECNALEYLRANSLLTRFRRIWCCSDVAHEVIVARHSASIRTFDELRVSYAIRDLKKIIEWAIAREESIENPRPTGTILWSVTEYHVTPLSYPGESFRKGMYRHDCEKISLRLKEGIIVISTRCLPADQRGKFEWRFFRAFPYVRGLPVVYEEAQCAACARPPQSKEK